MASKEAPRETTESNVLLTTRACVCMEWGACASPASLCFLGSFEHPFHSRSVLKEVQEQVQFACNAYNADEVPACTSPRAAWERLPLGAFRSLEVTEAVRL